MIAVMEVTKGVAAKMITILPLYHHPVNRQDLRNVVNMSLDATLAFAFQGDMFVTGLPIAEEVSINAVLGNLGN